MRERAEKNARRHPRPPVNSSSASSLSVYNNYRKTTGIYRKEIQDPREFIWHTKHLPNRTEPLPKTYQYGLGE